MHHQPRKRNDPFPQKKWRSYANEQHGHDDRSFRHLMHRCNQRAKSVSLKAQMTSATWDDDYWEGERDEEAEQPRVYWFRRLLALFILLPLSIVCVMSLYDQLIGAGNKMDIILSVPVWYTMLGCLAWIVLAKSKLFTTSFAYLYVLGHELTHVLAVVLSFGRVSGFKVALEGGHVRTNKSNIFIALSPYFIPLWAIVWAALYALINIFYPLQQFQGVLYGGIGFWWAFHLFWTAWLIPRDQPDLRENDTFFSLMIVYLANMLLLVFMLFLCNIVSIRAFGSGLVDNGRKLWLMFQDVFQLLF